MILVLLFIIEMANLFISTNPFLLIWRGWISAQPSIWSIDGPIVESDNGTSVNMSCVIFGDPLSETNMNWTKINGDSATSFTVEKVVIFSNTTVTFIRNSLIIASSSKTDFGKYECRAWNHVGTVSRQTQTVVKCK